MLRTLLVPTSVALALAAAGPAAAQTAPAAGTTPAAASIAAPAGSYKLDPTHASLTFQVMHLGLAPYTARFTSFDATLQFDPANAANIRLEATVDPASVETDYPNPEREDFDAKLRGAEWLNTAAHPQIRFVSTGVEQTGPTTARVTGDLTFLGVTKPLTLDVTLTGALAEHPFRKTPALGFTATGTLTRSDWGFSTYVPNIGDEVTLLITAEFLAAE